MLFPAACSRCLQQQAILAPPRASQKREHTSVLVLFARSTMPALTPPLSSTRCQSERSEIRAQGPGDGMTEATWHRGRLRYLLCLSGICAGHCIATVWSLRHSTWTRILIVGAFERPSSSHLVRFGPIQEIEDAEVVLPSTTVSQGRDCTQCCHSPLGLDAAWLSTQLS